MIEIVEQALKKRVNDDKLVENLFLSFQEITKGLLNTLY